MGMPLVAGTGRRILATKETEQGRIVQFMGSCQVNKWLPQGWHLGIVRLDAVKEFSARHAAEKVSDGTFIIAKA